MPKFPVPVDRLSYGMLDVQSIDSEWDGDRLVDGEWSFWEAKDLDAPDGYEGDGEFHAVMWHSQVAAIFLPDGTRINEGEISDYIEDHTRYPGDDDEDGVLDEGAFTVEQLERLFEQAEDLDYPEGPMMNYRYEVRGDSSDSIGGWGVQTDAVGAAYRLRHVPLVVVEYEGNMALALSGGGMDLSWEICEAFALLGYLPPTRFSDLPKMAGYPRGETHLYLIEACRRSLTSRVETAERDVESFNDKWPTAEGTPATLHQRVKGLLAGASQLRADLETDDEELSDEEVDERQRDNETTTTVEAVLSYLLGEYEPTPTTLLGAIIAKTPVPYLLVRRDASGTAAAETAVCEQHKDQAPPADTSDAKDAAKTELTRVYDNDALACIVCGKRTV